MTGKSGRKLARIVERKQRPAHRRRPTVVGPPCVAFLRGGSADRKRSPGSTRLRAGGGTWDVVGSTWSGTLCSVTTGGAESDGRSMGPANTNPDRSAHRLVVRTGADEVTGFIVVHASIAAAGSSASSTTGAGTDCGECRLGCTTVVLSSGNILERSAAACAAVGAGA